MKSKTQEPQELNKNNKKKKKKKNNMERQQANKNTFYNAIFTSSPKFLEDFFRNAPGCRSYEPEISAGTLN